VVYPFLSPWYQVGSKFYLVFPPVRGGGELYEHIIKRGLFTEVDAADHTQHVTEPVPGDRGDLQGAAARHHRLHESRAHPHW
jgi:hypothetical protein